MSAVKVSPKFQVVIPKDARSQLGIEAGDRLEVVTLDGRIELVPVKRPRDLRGFLKGIDTMVHRESSDRA